MIQEVSGAQPCCVSGSSRITVLRGAVKQEEEAESEAGAVKEAKSFRAIREVFRRVNGMVGIIPESVSQDISSSNAL